LAEIDLKKWCDASRFCPPKSGNLPGLGLTEASRTNYLAIYA